MRVVIDDLGNEVYNLLLSFMRDLDNVVKTECEETAKELVADLKRVSPKDTGKYGDNWTYTQEGKCFVVYNEKGYMTHWLEKGHQNFKGTTKGKQRQAHTKGGRTPGRPHIAPARDRAEMRLKQRLINRIGRG